MFGASQDRSTTSKAPPGNRGRGPSRGYSLVELIVVMLVILTIMAFAIPQLLASRRLAQQTAAVAFLQNLQTAQEHYYVTNGKYAASFAELDGFLVSNRLSAPVPMNLLDVRWRPLRNTSHPTLAFMMLPLPEQSQSFQAEGPNRPAGQNQSSGGGSAPTLDPNSGGGGSSQGGTSDGGSGSGAGSPSSSDTSGSGSENSSGNSSGSGGADGPTAGDPSTSDRLQLHGYEFALERPTPHTWRCTAQPLRDVSSSYSYFSDQSGVIRRELGSRATSQSAPI